MNITVNINAPELSNAILALAEALKGTQLPKNLFESVDANASVQQSAPVQQHAPAPVQNQSFQQQAPAPTPSVPIVNHVDQHPNQAPVQQQGPQAVPTSAPTYSMDQLAVAATQLVDGGKREDLVKLLAVFGVQALTALPKEQYGAFATKLREMGARI